MIIVDKIYQYGFTGFKNHFGDIYDEMLKVDEGEASNEDIIDSLKAHKFHSSKNRPTKTIEHIQNCKNF